MGRHSFKFVAGFIAAGLAACQGNDVANNSGPMFAVLPGTPVPAVNGAANVEQFELCKYGSGATFSYSVTAYGGANKTLPGAPQTGAVSLADGDCRVIAEYGGNGADVTVTETGADAGFHLDRVETTIATGQPPSTITGPTSSAGPSVSEFVSGTSGSPVGLRGALVEYYNAGDAVGEGCTPGYWKQSQHFDSWPAGYLPTDLFSAYFEDAFPGKTLLQVMQTGGGKLIALGRHTVAALLNSASGGVNYNLTTAQVINAFNTTFPTTNYGPQKDIFAGFNESGCPLN